MSERVVLYGAGGFGRELSSYLERDPCGFAGKDVVFVDDVLARDSFARRPCFSWSEFVGSQSGGKPFVVFVTAGSGDVRRRIVERLSMDNVTIGSYIDSRAFVSGEAVIGEGSVICPFVTITSNAKIGVGFQANIYSYVAHDCRVGDYVTLAPGAKINGNVVLDDHSYVGTGAVVKQGKLGAPVVIGEHAVVGMGAVVTKSVPSGATVVGNPARIVGS